MAVAVFLFSTKLDRAAEKIVPSGLILEIENIYIVRSVGLSLLVTVFYISGQQLQNKFYMFPLGWIKRSAGTERTLSSDA